MLYDSHNHLQDLRLWEQTPEIIATMKDAGIGHCVVNGTCEEDWPRVAQLADDHPNFITPSFGLHPWLVEKRSPDWFNCLKAYLVRFPRAGVGECGLDRWMESPDLEAQHAVFRNQLTLAQELERPLTIHCLRAWGPLMDELRSCPILPRFLLHSFSGSLEIGLELAKLGGFFSFSGYFLHDRKTALRETFRQLPATRILLETDAPDMLPPSSFQEITLGELNHPANLRMIAQGFHAHLGISPEQASRNSQRFHKVF